MKKTSTKQTHLEDVLFRKISRYAKIVIIFKVKNSLLNPKHLVYPLKSHRTLVIILKFYKIMKTCV